MWILYVNSLYKEFFKVNYLEGLTFLDAGSSKTNQPVRHFKHTSLCDLILPKQSRLHPSSSLIFPPPPLPLPQATGLSYLCAFAFTVPPAFPSSAPDKFSSAFQAWVHVTSSENPLTMKTSFRSQFPCPGLLVVAVTVLEQ